MIGNALHTLNAPHERFEFLTNLFDVLYENNDMKLPAKFEVLWSTSVHDTKMISFH